MMNTKSSWEAYLKTANPLVKDAWSTLSYYVKGLPIPYVGPCTSGYGSAGYMLAWDVDKDHLEIEIYDDNSIEWFYRDRNIDECAGGECSLQCITVDLLSKLYIIAGITKPRSTIAAQVIGMGASKPGDAVIEEDLKRMQEELSVEYITRPIGPSLDKDFVAKLAKGYSGLEDMPPAGRPSGRPLTDAPARVSLWSRFKSLFAGK